MNKLKMHTPDRLQEKIGCIAELFPGCVTEARDGKGAVQQAVDFDQLRQELSSRVIEGARESYRLDWPGKREALLAANSPIASTLRPNRHESVNFNATTNLFIEGDNLDALKLLQETYLNRIKLIYVDPPYNTGNDFIYRDDYAETSSGYLARSQQFDDARQQLIANPESNGRFHSAWLSMIYPRLRLARNLLQDDGVVMISIDDNEVHNLRRVCDEIFGESQFLAQLIWKARQFTDARSNTKVSTDHEYIVCYGKSANASFRGQERDESKYQNPDNDRRGPWMSRSILGLATKDQRPNLHYHITDPSSGTQFHPPANTGWRYAKERMDALVADGCILFPSMPSGRPREKKFRSDLQSEFTSFPTIIDDVYTSHGTAAVREIFGFQAFDFPKPVELLERLCEQHLESTDTVLDLFGGSATTAEAVMKLNARDGGSRRHITIQLAEGCDASSEAFRAGLNTIAEIGKERIRRSGRRLTESLGLHGGSLDVGFRVLKVDTSNMKDVYYQPDVTSQDTLQGLVDNVKDDRSDEDLLFQVLIDWGVDLSLAIKPESIKSKTVYFVDSNALAACFEPGIDEPFIKELAKRQPLRVVFRDTGYGSDATKINVEQIFRLVSPGTEVKCI